MTEKKTDSEIQGVHDAAQRLLDTLSRLSRADSGGLFPYGITRIELEVSVPNVATVKVGVEGPATAAGDPEAMFEKVFALRAARLDLPPLQTDAGTVARMLLAEAMTPANSAYDAALAQTSMNAMKATVVNRLTKPSEFGAPGATTHRDIICAPSQFAGFSKNSSGDVVVAAGIAANINDIVTKANTGSPGPFFLHLKMAIDAASTAVTDPFAGITNIGGVTVLGGTFGWRTAGSGSPGGRFVAIPMANGGVILGNQFFTLKP